MLCRVFVVLSLALCLAASAIVPAAAQHLLPADGFNKVPWGARLDQKEGFHALVADGPVAIYAQEQNSYTFGGFGVVKIYYAAKDGVFFAAFMPMRNEEMYRQVFNSLRLEFGQPEREGDTTFETARWTRNGIQAILQHSKINNSSQLCYVSQAYGDAEVLQRAQTLFGTINTSTLERDSWNNPKRFDLDLFIKK
ncbi:hypothetical protein [Megalodesulfovibrio paquesii]